MRIMWPVLEPSTPLVTGWALDAIVEHLEAVSTGEVRRLLINVPPGFSKSMCTSVFFPAWLWGPRARPEARVIATSYAADLAIRDNLRCRTLMRSELFTSMWGESFGWSGDQNAKTRYENTRGGWRQVASTGSALVGHRGDVVIVDDPHSTQSAESDQRREEVRYWFAETLPTRLNDLEKSSIIVIMQRLHARDISGLILANDLGYEHLCLPMEFEVDHPFTSTRFQDPRSEHGDLLWPERFSRKSVDELKKVFRSQGGTYAEAGQLQQRPAPRGGGMFQEKDFHFRADAPEPSEILVGPVRGWDLAATASSSAAFTAGVKLCRLKTGETVVLDVRRAQLEAREVYDFMRNTAQMDGNRIEQSIPQDPGQAGKDQKRHIAGHLAGFPLHFSPESGSKEMRAAPLAAQGEGGNLVLVRAPWNDPFIAEAGSFPMGDWKDQIDAASRAFGRLTKPRSTEKLAAPRRFGR